jgi:invasion protein IalB
MKRLFLCVALMAASCGFSAYAEEEAKTPAAPKANIKKQEQIKDWELICGSNPQPDGTMRDMCSLLQSVREKDSKQPFATVEITRDPAGKLGMFFNVLPIGIEFSKGIKLEFEGGGSAPVEIRTCFPDKCVTSVALDDKALAKFKTAKSGTFTFSNIYGVPFRIPLSLNGFAEGLKGI